MNRNATVEHLSGNYKAHLSFAADNNPWAVYQHIEANYPGMFDRWDRGYEESDAAKDQLVEFLDRRAKESGNPEQFVINLLDSLPYNPETGADNWTKIDS